MAGQRPRSLDDEYLDVAVRAWAVRRHPAPDEDELEAPRATWGPRLPSEFLEDSVDVLTFVMHLEEKLGVDIPLAKVGPALSRMTFQELAAELCRLSGP